MLYVVFTVVICVLIFLYKYINGNYDYWKKLDIPFHPPVAFFGNLKEAITMKKSLGQIYTDIYNSHNDAPYVGFYKIRQPGLVIRDPELVRDVMIKDFHSFDKNAAVLDEKADPILSKNPFFQYGHRWKVTRSQLTHCFTSGKIKLMLPLMTEVSKTMIKYLEMECRTDNIIEVKELAAKFTTDSVATCAFGLEGGSFTNPDAEFRKMGKEIFNYSTLFMIKSLCIFLFPSTTKIFSVAVVPKNVDHYFRTIIKSTLKYRKENNISRNDFLDIINELKDKPGDYTYTDDDITAHALSFFIDGFETSSVTLSFILYDLASNPDVQKKLRTEIEETMKKHGGELSWDAIQEMHYLHAVISESQRMHTSAMAVFKICTIDYEFPRYKETGKTLKVEKDTPIIIPIYGLHHDPKYFPNPEKFDPDRFSEDNKANIVKGAYLPFGEGPRMCIGMRFALLQIKVAIIAIIKNFDISVNQKTKEPLEIDPAHIILVAKGGLWLNFNKLNGDGNLH